MLKAKQPKLEMKTFRVLVCVVPPKYEEILFGAKPREEYREIQGYTLKDAKRRAGIN